MKFRALVRMTAIGALVAACSTPSVPSDDGPTEPPALAPEAGFVEVAPRTVTLNGAAVSIETTARLFYDLHPADVDPENAPIVVLFNGFSANIVRAFGTGPFTVVEGGAVAPNPAALTRFANVLYFEPRQGGFSYDLIKTRSPLASDCGAAIFNEYVDAGDVLLGMLGFLEAHPRYHGRIYWLAESYAGVRVAWMLAFLRGRFDLAPYDDPTLRDRIAAIDPSRLLGGQILLQPWVAGSAHTIAIDDVCHDPEIIAAVEATVGSVCPVANACYCADTFSRSRYNFAFTLDQQRARVFEGNRAQVTLPALETLLGVPLDSIAHLASRERSTGFKCSTRDDTVPPEDDLVAKLGQLPANQEYFLPYAPLQPGKEYEPQNPDWRAKTLVGAAFLDDLRDVPTFVTDGPYDLVVPIRALGPALTAIAPPNTIDASNPDRMRVTTPDGDRFIDIGHYPAAGHMITMLEPTAFADDIAAWLAAH